MYEFKQNGLKKLMVIPFPMSSSLSILWLDTKPMLVKFLLQQNGKTYEYVEM